MSVVLVIEDNKDNLKIVTYALNRAGYSVVSAERGEEGLVLAISEQPIFILMDINLPGMDGIETTRRIRESEVDDKVPIIAITSYAMSGDRERILAAGCNGYIEKPIDPLTIVEEIRSVIERMNKNAESRGGAG
ncbi:MAG TPA: response regulator [Treponema sp.]|nr:MAG: two-component system response regulator [Treponema sp. GWC1_61_84]OHE68868.1 MAG: two-component system response regulator [Treponema sp. RIFOXYC1_FULL_61_9]HCM25931.1 response regulator [Treponema sp.]